MRCCFLIPLEPFQTWKAKLRVGRSQNGRFSNGLSTLPASTCGYTGYVGGWDTRRDPLRCAGGYSQLHSGNVPSKVPRMRCPDPDWPCPLCLLPLFLTASPSHVDRSQPGVPQTRPHACTGMGMVRLNAVAGPWNVSSERWLRARTQTPVGETPGPSLWGPRVPLSGYRKGAEH